MTDWRMTFLPQFKACVDAGTYSLMCSYNRYCHCNKHIFVFLDFKWKGYYDVEN